MSASTAAHVADYVAQLTGADATVRTDFCGGYEIVAADEAVARVDAHGDIHILVGIHALTLITEPRAA